MVEFSEIKKFLDEKAEKYNQPVFIETDPIRVPKQFAQKENIEIAGFLAATIAWGQRPAIIKSAFRMMYLMGNDPYLFLMEADEHDFAEFGHFAHRTFNASDLLFFIRSLKNIYQNHGGLQQIFEKGFQTGETVKSALIYFRSVFFEIQGEPRTRKHIADVAAGSAGKRLNMFLRWMVRNDNRGVDFGIWKGIPASSLMLPLDLHTGNAARKLGLLLRRQNDWKAVEEITAVLRNFDPADPVKYDFALFGLGVFENF